MSKLIDKLGSSKFFMSIVMVCDIIFNIILLVFWAIALKNYKSTSIILIILHFLFLALEIYIFIQLLKKYKFKPNLELKELVFASKKNKWFNVGIISILFLWQIIYNFVVLYLALSTAIANIIYSPQYGMQINFVIVSVYFIIALVAFIFALLNVLYYAFLIKKLLQKPKDTNTDILKNMS